MKKVLLCLGILLLGSSLFAQKHSLSFGVGVEGQQKGYFGMGPIYQLSYRHLVLDWVQLEMAGSISLFDDTGYPSFEKWKSNSYRSTSSISNLTSQSLELNAVVRAIRLGALDISFTVGTRLKLYDYIHVVMDKHGVDLIENKTTEISFREGDEFRVKDITALSIPVGLEVSYNLKNHMVLRLSGSYDKDQWYSSDLDYKRDSFRAMAAIGYRF
ncbi:hypothetical protein K5X82_11665 [Halosquirtibacter xylanolyticus]|uniref:hypothetical protein n=1 Tax=Halosquirtibacter xylanolyticus TaxID=3374599 RepID=UPI00374939FD|nr:hypothetical protein K5X82_11665 [Prolixibacteraceae bacterium]